jgi:hypothetical protein
MKLLAITILGLFLTACSVTNDAVTVGKKCVVKGDKVYYSYVWFYNKGQGLQADETQCEQIAEK